jgi:UDPglucose 6-dehydrogenase
MGHQVACVDNNKERSDGLKGGLVPVYEPGLEELIRSNLGEGRLTFTTSIAEGVQASEVVFICVATPASPDGSADLSAVEAVAREIAVALTEYKVIAEKSTVPVRTGEWVKRTLRLYNSHSVDFDMASVPEFLREGSAIWDFNHPDRIVIGVESKRAEALMRKLF